MGILATRRRNRGRSGVPSTLGRFVLPALSRCIPILTLGLSLLALGLLAPASALASYTRVIESFPVCTAAGGQFDPAISADTVVWSDWRSGDYDIYGYDLTTRTEFPVCTASGDQVNPAISGDSVVWADSRTGDDYDIYGYDLATKREFPVCTAAGTQSGPAVSGDIVVWGDSRSDTDDIYGYDLATKREFPVCTAAGTQGGPEVSGDIVVWVDYRSDAYEPDIYGYDLATKRGFPVCTAAGNQGWPAVSGDIVVWADYRSGGYDIYGHDLTTRTEFPVCTAAGTQIEAAVSGDTVVYRQGDGETDIYGYDLATGTEFPVCTVVSRQVCPAISGDTVVWTDMRNGSLVFDIYGARLAPAVTGYVYDGHGAEGEPEHAVQDAKVEIRESGSETVLDSAHTDEEGKFALSFVWETGKTYRATVTLESADGLLVMKRDDDLVSFSRDFSDPSPDAHGLEIDCSKVADLSAASLAKGDVENCASVWHWLQRNRRVAQEVGRDLTATLTVNAFSTEEGGTGAWYEPDANAISIGRHVMDDDTHAAGGGAPDDADPAPWNFRKNRETHEFGHAMMDVVMAGGDVAGYDIANHAGYANRDTGDSLSEGFAEFWSMVVDEATGITGQPDRYDAWGYLTGADRRMAWSPVDPAAPLAVPTDYPDEEFAAAGLLRTLQGVLGGGQAGFLKIADNLPVGGNLTDLRDALVTSGVPPGGIDPAFFSYGFFADSDGDWTHDEGEPVGAGNGTACKLLWDESVGPVTVLERPERRDHPFDPNSFVAVNLSGLRTTASESWVTVAVKHAGRPAADFSDKVLVTGMTGLIFVDLDEAATGAVITATGPDGGVSPDKLSFTAGEWKAARARATGDVAFTKTFRVCRVTVGNPVAPKTMSRSRSSIVTCTVKPRHTAGTFPVRIYKYRSVAGKWRSYGYVKAKASDYRTYTRCSCKVKLPSKGTWRLRALAQADTYHKATWSRGYDYVIVR